MLNSYDQFLTTYAARLSEACKKLNELSILQSEDATFAKSEALENIRQYDFVIRSWIDNTIAYPNRQVSVTEIATVALGNMNNTGTEMKQILNAIEELYDQISIALNLSDKEDHFEIMHHADCQCSNCFEKELMQTEGSAAFNDACKQDRSNDEEWDIALTQAYECERGGDMNSFVSFLKTNYKLVKITK